MLGLKAIRNFDRWTQTRVDGVLVLLGICNSQFDRRLFLYECIVVATGWFTRSWDSVTVFGWVEHTEVLGVQLFLSHRIESLLLQIILVLYRLFLFDRDHLHSRWHWHCRNLTDLRKLYSTLILTRWKEFFFVNILPGGVPDLILWVDLEVAWSFWYLWFVWGLSSVILAVMRLINLL